MEPHDLEVDVKKTAEIAAADLVVYQAGFQPAVDDAVGQNAQGDTLDVAGLADLIPVEESAAEHEEHADEEGHDHDHGNLDPHFWQDPLRVAAVADAVAEEPRGHR
ncbi:zinc ABC transporter solute-binding protein [Nocardioides sp. W3-2-3]|nr:zinc ABC transporter solute-binding protein [Nocardioides convexus]